MRKLAVGTLAFRNTPQMLPNPDHLHKYWRTAFAEGTLRMVATYAKRDDGEDILTTSEVAALLGVSEPTLRRWDEAGKFRPKRHPINGYRMYRRSEVLKLRATMARATI
jgi:excisionase family DNA binding protein